MSIALSKEKVQTQNGMALVFSYITLFIINWVVIFLANALFPAHVVLGTYALSPTWSLYLAVIELTIICAMVIPIVTYYTWRRGKAFTPKEWMLTYFVVNTLTLWGIARFADKVGFGLSAWYVAVLLGAALDWVQGLGMVLMGKLTKNFV